MGLGVNNKGSAAPIMSYSFGVKGIYAGVTLDGTVLVPRKECNTTFYGKNVTLEDIIAGKVKAPDNADYRDIVKLIEVNSRVCGLGPHKMDEDDLVPLSNTQSDDVVEQNAEDEPVQMSDDRNDDVGGVANFDAFDDEA